MKRPRHRNVTLLGTVRRERKKGNEKTIYPPKKLRPGGRVRQTAPNRPCSIHVHTSKYRTIKTSAIYETLARNVLNRRHGRIYHQFGWLIVANPIEKFTMKTAPLNLPSPLLN